MSLKFAVTIGVFIGSIIGSYIPVFFGASSFSFWSILGGGIGSLVGIYVAYRIYAG